MYKGYPIRQINQANRHTAKEKESPCNEIEVRGKENAYLRNEETLKRYSHNRLRLSGRGVDGVPVVGIGYGFF